MPNAAGRNLKSMPTPMPMLADSIKFIYLPIPIPIPAPTNDADADTDFGYIPIPILVEKIHKSHSRRFRKYYFINHGGTHLPSSLVSCEIT